MDEHAEGDARIRGTGILAEVPLRSRPRLRLAHPRPRDVPRPLDCHLLPARTLSHRQTQVPERRDDGRKQTDACALRNDGTRIIRLRNIHGAGSLGSTLQGRWRIRTAGEHTGLQPQHQ